MLDPRTLVDDSANGVGKPGVRQSSIIGTMIINEVMLVIVVGALIQTFQILNLEVLVEDEVVLEKYI